MHPCGIASGMMTFDGCGGVSAVVSWLVHHPHVHHHTVVFHSYFTRVVSPDKTYTLQAEDELDKQEWIEALQVSWVVFLCVHTPRIHTMSPTLNNPLP